MIPYLWNTCRLVDYFTGNTINCITSHTWAPELWRSWREEWNENWVRTRYAKYLTHVYLFQLIAYSSGCFMLFFLCVFVGCQVFFLLLHFLLLCWRFSSRFIYSFIPVLYLRSLFVFINIITYSFLIWALRLGKNAVLCVPLVWSVLIAEWRNAVMYLCICFPSLARPHVCTELVVVLGVQVNPRMIFEVIPLKISIHFNLLK